MSFRLDASKLELGLKSLETKSIAAVKMYASTGAKKFESSAKSNAPWTDRTGIARKSLTGYVEDNWTNKIRICLSHGVYYGIYLELAHEKRFAIIDPTIRLVSPEILRGYERLLERM